MNQFLILKDNRNNVLGHLTCTLREDNNLNLVAFGLIFEFYHIIQQET